MTFVNISKNPYFPVFLDLRDQACLVVGGGDVAIRKAERLLEVGAKVVLVALVCVAPPEGALFLPRPFEEADLEGQALVFAATDDRELNAKIAAMAAARNIWANAVDDPEACRFIMPAVVRQDDLVIAVSTGGQSPILARRIKEQLQKEFSPEYGRLAALLGELRRAWLQEPQTAQLSFDQRREIWERILDLPLLQWLQERGEEHVRQLVQGHLRSG
jgi:siroheme synthase-like protein